MFALQIESLGLYSLGSTKSPRITKPVTINNLDGTETLVEDCYRYHGPPIPKGTISNGANIPWILRRFWPAWGCWYDRAVIGHDWRYDAQNCTRKEADDELYCNMTSDMDMVLRKLEHESVLSTLSFCLWGSLTCSVFYIGVRIGGWVEWQKRS